MKIGGAWRIRDFRRYWTAQTVSILGDQVSGLAVPLVAVTLLQAGASQMGLLTSLGRAPLLIFGLLAGVWVDRVDRRRLLVLSDIGRAAVVMIIPTAALVGALTLPLLMAVVFVSATLGVAFSIAANAYLPEIVPRDQLIDANARISQPRAVAQAAGPGLGGALVQAVTGPVAMILDAVSFIISAALLSRIDVRCVHQRHRPNSRFHPLHDIGEGLLVVWRQPLLRASGMAAATFNLFNSAVMALLVLHLSQELQLSAAEIGVVMTAAGPGAFLGAVLATPISRRVGVGPAMIGGLVLAGGSFLLIQVAGGSQLRSLLIMVLAMFINGVGQPLYNINQAGLRQAIVRRSLQGRVQATLSVVAGVAAPVGAIAGGLVGQSLGTGAALMIAGGGAAAASGWLLCSPVRTLRTMPEPVDA